MVKRKSKTKKKRNISLNKSFKNVTFKNVPIASMKLKGSLETLGEIDYHYQKYENTFEFFDKLMVKDRSLRKLLCIPSVGDSWMRSFLKVVLDSEDIDTSELMVKNVEPVDPLVSVEKFNQMVRKCDKRFISISVQLIVKGKPGTHANILVIDTKHKIVELFEPHGNRSSETSMDSLPGAYKTSDKLVRKYFKKYFPNYKYVSPTENLPTFGLQAKVDAYSGMCVTWCIMYLHYRLLNPYKTQKQIIRKMKSIVNRPFLLKYAKYVEDTIK